MTLFFKDLSTIDNFFGERCPDYDEDCVNCYVWNLYDRKEIMRKAIWKMASNRLTSVDDYIMIVKQAIADYEAIGGSNRE